MSEGGSNNWASKRGRVKGKTWACAWSGGGGGGGLGGGGGGNREANSLFPRVPFALSLARFAPFPSHSNIYYAGERESLKKTYC